MLRSPCRKLLLFDFALMLFFQLCLRMEAAVHHLNFCLSSDYLWYSCFVACFIKDCVLFLVSTLCVYLGLGTAVYFSGLLSLHVTS